MSARWYVRGPSFGPVHTTLASGRFGGRRVRYRRPYWPSRFTRLSYWLLGIWALEAAFWMLYGTALLVLLACHAWHARSARTA